MARGPRRKTGDDVLLKSAEMIGWALGGLEREIAQTRERLANLTAQAATLRARVGASAHRGTEAVSAAAEQASETVQEVKKRTMSPEARKRISEMMKKRWAERRRKKGTAKGAKAAKA
jgi:hypothetical protein